MERENLSNRIESKGRNQFNNSRSPNGEARRKEKKRYRDCNGVSK